MTLYLILVWSGETLEITKTKEKTSLLAAEPTLSKHSGEFLQGKEVE